MEKKASGSLEPEPEVRKGPWTMEEDLILVNYIANHGDGVWNSVAKSAGLRRTGKSCRLRWLNYLRPDVRRGNITPQERLLIMELHAKLGNRWSKIAKHLPGRTDNEIKNFWRTRMHKHGDRPTPRNHEAGEQLPDHQKCTDDMDIDDQMMTENNAEGPMEGAVGEPSLIESSHINGCWSLDDLLSTPSSSLSG